MKDPEFITLKNKFFYGFGIVLLFVIPSFFVIYNKLLIQDSIVQKRIKKEDTFLIFMTKSKCKECKKIEKVLAKENLDYEIINIEKEKNYQSILVLLQLGKNEISPPTVISVEQGIVKTIFREVEKEELTEWIEQRR